MLITENDFGFIRKIKNDYTYFYTGAPTITTGHNVRVFPNPAGIETTIQIKLNEASMLWVSILNGLGQEVLVLYDGYHPGVVSVFQKMFLVFRPVSTFTG